MDEKTKYAFRINKLTFSDGTEVEPRKVNVIIGPNNSGKSRVLKEIRHEILGHWSSTGLTNFSLAVLSEVQLNLPCNISEFESAYEPLEKLVTRTINGWRVRDYCHTGMMIEPNGSINYYNNQPTFYAPSINELRRELDTSLNTSNEFFAQIIGPTFVCYSGTDERLLLSIGEPARGLEDDSYNTLSSALDADPYLYSISNITKELFNKDVILDATSSRQVIIPRVGSNFSEYRNSISGKAAPDYSQLFDSTPLSEEGDGLRSFIAVLVSLLGNRKPVYLLDEPESFLHPPYAFEMGKEIASLAMGSSKTESQLFISSHSSYLIRGLLSEMRDKDLAEELQILRLTREGSTTHVHLIDTNALNKLITTTGFTPAYVDALFSDNPVLVEAPRDAELFTQISTKLRPVKDTLFVPVNGKQNFSRKIPFYSNAGIRTRLVADFDLLKSTDQFAQIMRESGVPSELTEHGLTIAKTLHDAVSEEADQLHPSNEKSGKRSPEAKHRIDSLYKHPTPSNLNQYGDDLSSMIDELITRLIPFGILIIRTGALETIFPDITKTKNTEHSDDWYYRAIEYVAQVDTNTLESVPFVRNLIALLDSRFI